MKKFPYVDPKIVDALEMMYPPLNPSLEDVKNPHLSLNLAHRAGQRELIIKLKSISVEQNKR